jgi:hypothetical protein
MEQSNLNGEKKSKRVINKSVIYVDKYFRKDTNDNELFPLRGSFGTPKESPRDKLQRQTFIICAQAAFEISLIG